MTVAIIGAGVMGETLLSGLLRAGRRAGTSWSARSGGSARTSCRSGTASRWCRNIDAAGKADTLVLVVKPQDMADVLDELAPVVRPGQLVVSLAAGITTAVHRGAAARRGRGRAGHAEHPGARRRGDGRHLPRLALRREAPRRGRGADGLDRQGDPGPRAAAGRGDRDLRLRPGVHLLRRRVDDRGRRAPRAAAQRRLRAGRADRGRLGQAAARHRRAPGRAARAGHLARRHHRRRAPRARGPQGAGRVPRAIEAARDRSRALAEGMD